MACVLLRQSEEYQHRWCRSVGDRGWSSVPVVADDIEVRDVRQAGHVDQRVGGRGGTVGVCGE